MTKSHVIYDSCKLLELLTKFVETMTQFAFLHTRIYRNNQRHFSHFLLPCTQCSAMPLTSNRTLILFLFLLKFTVITVWGFSTLFCMEFSRNGSRMTKKGKEVLIDADNEQQNWEAALLLAPSGGWWKVFQQSVFSWYNLHLVIRFCWKHSVLKLYWWTLLITAKV